MPTFSTWLSGWEGAVVSLALFSAALVLESTALAAAGALVSTPFCFFASGFPIFGGIAWAALVGNFVAACIVGRRRDVAFAALTPFAVICVFLAVLAIRGIRLARI